MAKGLRAEKVRPKPLPDRHDVYVIGAGFSAALGYPLVNDLLVRLWPKLSKDTKSALGKVVKFHHPNFDSKRATSFPNIEILLSEMMANEQLFDASRTSPGKFTKKALRNVRRQLLLAITDWFHELREAHSSAQPVWLTKFVGHLVSTNSVIISFNWDLVLDALLFDQIGSANYGLDDTSSGPVLLKPHGSLNWFGGTFGKRINAERKELLYADADEKTYRFRHFRSPVGKRDYMPLIIPPVFNKSFDEGIYRETWKRCVSELSRAKTVTFLGYSLPDADLQARFILRCGFENQHQGELQADGERASPTGPAKVVIINPDVLAARRLEAAVNSESCFWKPMLVADWANAL